MEKLVCKNNKKIYNIKKYCNVLYLITLPNYNKGLNVILDCFSTNCWLVMQLLKF